MANPSVVVDFLANTRNLVDGVKTLGKETDAAGKATGKVDWKRIAAWGGAAAAVGAGAKFVKDATSQTQDLAKATLSLQRVTNLDTRTASQWAEVLKSRNIDVNTFNKSMVILSKQVVAYQAAQKNAAETSREYDQAEAALSGTIAKGGKAGKDATDTLNKLGNAAQSAQTAADKAGQPFSDLGVSLADVRKGDTNKVLLEMSDGFDKMGAGAKRNALTQKLLGRSASQLTPLLYSGSAAIQDQLGIAHKYGAELGDNTTANVKQLIADQREMGIAMDGVKVKVGVALLPVMVQLSKVLVQVMGALQPIISNGTVLKITLGIITAAFVAWKVATIAMTIAQWGLNAAMLPTIGIVVAVVAGIIALIAVGYLLYKNWDKISAGLSVAFDKIKQAGRAVFDWFKSNWPLLLGILAGPMGLAVVMVIRNWDKIKSATSAAWDFVKGKVAGVLASIRGAVSSFTSWMGTAWASVRTQLDKVAGWFSHPLDAAKAMLDGIKRAVGAIPTAISNVVAAVHREATRVADAIKAPVNLVIGAWNALAFTVPTVTLPKVAAVKVAGKTVVPGFGGNKIGGQRFDFPNIPKLATGGVFDVPTLAVVGEGAGREIVAPETLLRQIVGAMVPEVHVYIGDTELRDVVRVEVVAADNATASALLGGVA